MKKLSIIISLTLGSFTIAQNHSQMMKNILKPYPEPTHFTQIDGNELAYTKSGNGKKTLIFIHGLSSNADAWSKNIAELKKDFTCIAIDLPGYGKSFKTSEVYTPTYFSETVVKLMDRLKIKKATIIGHSMGGQSAIKLAVNHPEKLEKLILIAPAGLEQFSDLEAQMMTAVMTSKTVQNTSDDQIEKNYAINFYQMPKDVESMIDDRKKIKKADDFVAHTIAIEKSVKGMLEDKVIDNLQNIKTPTLVLLAKEDKLIPNPYLHPTLKIDDIASIAKSSIKNAEVKMISEAGHFLQYEKSKEVNAEIKAFVNTK